MLVSGGYAPHILQMIQQKVPQADASHHTAAVARWDDDGGASESSSRKTGAEASENHGRPRRAIENKTKDSYATHTVCRR
jgi:hypothetical protein